MGPRSPLEETTNISVSGQICLIFNGSGGHAPRVRQNAALTSFAAGFRRAPALARAQWRWADLVRPLPSEEGRTVRRPTIEQPWERVAGDLPRRVVATGDQPYDTFPDVLPMTHGPAAGLRRTTRMPHARANPGLRPCVMAPLHIQARFIIRPQLLTRISPLPTGRAVHLAGS